MKRSKLAVWAVAVLVLSGYGALRGAEHGFVTAIAVFIGLVIVLGLFALLSLGFDTLYERATASHPVATAAVSAGIAIPLIGAALAWPVSSWGVVVAQDAGVFATLAQLIVTLLIAFAVEAAAFPVGHGSSPRERRAGAVAVGGVAAGAVVGLVAAIWGLVHPHPGLLFLGMAVSAILLLVVILVMLPVTRLLRHDALPVE